MTEPERLYSLQDVARLLGVTASALSNSRKRGSGILQSLPAPAYCYGNLRAGGTAPLWTRRQLAEWLAERSSLALETLGPDDDY